MIRKILPVFAIVVLLVVVIACSQNAGSVREELVSVDFSGSARVLVSELEPFDKNDLYWFYAARKSLTQGGEMLDGSGLKSGETPSYDWDGAAPVRSDGGKGLGIGRKASEDKLEIGLQSIFYADSTFNGNIKISIDGSDVSLKDYIIGVVGGTY